MTCRGTTLVISLFLLTLPESGGSAALGREADDRDVTSCVVASQVVLIVHARTDTSAAYYLQATIDSVWCTFGAMPSGVSGLRDA